MAVIWRNQQQSHQVEVRQAGQSVRLYTNGVFHSQWNPTRPVAGNLWDLLWLPAFFVPKNQLRRVLVLGVGGGAVINALKHFFPTVEIIGVDISAVHLKVARQFFNVDKSVQLHQFEAKSWVQNFLTSQNQKTFNIGSLDQSNDYEIIVSKTKSQIKNNTQTYMSDKSKENTSTNRLIPSSLKFDLIIDDLFSDANGLPERAFPVCNEWTESLSLLCRPKHGVVVFNFPRFADIQKQALKTIGEQRRVFTAPGYENRIVTVGKSSLNIGDWQQQLQGFEELDQRRKSCRLAYSQRSF